MKPSKAQLSESMKTIVFPKTLHRLRKDFREAHPTPKPLKRDNIFSKSRDTREDRGSRQMKTSHNAQTFPH